MTVPAGKLLSVLGVREVHYKPHESTLAVVDEKLGEAQ
jgi:hypothetical protein